jgi:hypothetical protein
VYLDNYPNAPKLVYWDHEWFHIVVRRNELDLTATMTPIPFDCLLSVDVSHHDVANLQPTISIN